MQTKKAGRPLTPAQKQARRLIKAHPDWSAAKIAAQCGLTRDAVQKDAVYKATRHKADTALTEAMSKAVTAFLAGSVSVVAAAKNAGVSEWGLRQALRRANAPLKRRGEAMQLARQLLRESPGTPQAQIARKAGLQRSALGKDRICREIIEKYKQEKENENHG